MKTLIIAVLIALVGCVRAADLNAPINTTPTIGSEIRRGMDAASQCIGTFPALNFAQCIIGTGERNRQKVVDSKPFDLGLFFKAWVSMDIVGYPTQEFRGTLSKSIMRMGAAWPHPCTKSGELLRKTLG